MDLHHIHSLRTPISTLLRICRSSSHPLLGDLLVVYVAYIGSFKLYCPFPILSYTTSIFSLYSATMGISLSYLMADRCGGVA